MARGRELLRAFGRQRIGRGLRTRFYLAFAGFAALTCAIGTLGSCNVESVSRHAGFVAGVVTPVLTENAILHEAALRMHGLVLDVTADSVTGGTEARLDEAVSLTERSLARIRHLMPGDRGLDAALDEARTRFDAFHGLVLKARREQGISVRDTEGLAKSLSGLRNLRAALQARIDAAQGGTADGRDASQAALGLLAVQELVVRHASEGRTSLLEEGPKAIRARLRELSPRIASSCGSDPACTSAFDRIVGSLHSSTGIIALRSALDASSERMAALKRDMDRAEEIYGDTLTTIGDIARERMWRTRMDEQSVISRARITTVFAILAGLAFTLVVCVVFSRRVVEPLAGMTDAMHRMAAGDLDTEPPSWPLRDEIGALAAALAVFREDGMRRRELEEREAGHRATVLLADERERARAEATRQNERFELALGNMSQGLVVIDREHRLVVCNARYREIFRLPDALALPGTTLVALMEHRIRSGTLSIETGYEGLIPGSGEEGHATHDLPDGRSLAVRRVKTSDGGWVATYEDVSEQRRSVARIRHMATHDALTDLPNRTSMRQALERNLRNARPGYVVAAHMLDLDKFKDVNDTLGHPAGDALLNDVATRLSGLPGNALVARLGGDEFALVQTVGDLAEAEELARAAIEALSAPFHFDGHLMSVGASVGIAIGSGPDADPDELLKRADIALYSAKAAGRGRHAVFAETMEIAITERRALEDDLRYACGAGDLRLHYQPLVSFTDGRVTGFEALLRWTHPTRGEISPATFVPIAEELGLIDRIGAWAIRRACLDAVSWPDDVKVAVNLSPVQFRRGGDIVSVVEEALAESGLPAFRLGLEITESVLLGNDARTLSTLHSLRALGVSISLDDFGTGFSSLSYLRKFPFDRLKIDRSFVGEMLVRDDCASIVRAVIGLARELDMTTVAEGVETAEQFERLREEGCDDAQGYLVSRPRPFEECAAIIAGRVPDALAMAA